jgi:hypothetical protein
MSDEDKDKDHPDNKKLSGENWSSLREKKRSCTDCLCLVKVLNDMIHRNYAFCSVTSDCSLDRNDCYWFYCHWSC